MAEKICLPKAKDCCYVNPWVLDMDISKFFDTINHELLMKAVSLKRSAYEFIQILSIL